MRATFIAIAAVLGLSCASAAPTPDITDLLKKAASAAQERHEQQNNTNANGTNGGSYVDTGNQQQPQQQQPQQQQEQQQQNSSQSGLGSALGGLFGALTGNGQSNEAPANPDRPQENSGSGQSGLGSALGGLLGGITGGNSGSSSTDGNGGGGLSGLGQLGNVIAGIISTSNVKPADLVGSWRYAQPAIAFESSNFLQKAGGAAASSVIVEKLTPYYNQAGIDKLEATFNEDGTFEFRLPRVTLSGTYALTNENEPGEFTFNFTAMKKIPVGSMKAHVEKAAGNATITFDISKLIKVVDTVAKVSGQKTLQAASSLLNQYEGLNAGFELTPVASAK